MSDFSNDGYPDGSFIELPLEVRKRAALYVAAHAYDSTDAAELLAALGLTKETLT